MTDMAAGALPAPGGREAERKQRRVITRHYSAQCQTPPEGTVRFEAAAAASKRPLKPPARSPPSLSSIFHISVPGKNSFPLFHDKTIAPGAAGGGGGMCKIETQRCPSTRPRSVCNRTPPRRRSRVTTDIPPSLSFLSASVTRPPPPPSLPTSQSAL